MTEIDLGLGLLDHQLLDVQGRRCGKVDDLELEGIREGAPRVAAIVVGPRAWAGRGWIAHFVSRFAPARAVHVPWDEVAEVTAGVQLRRTARELRLARGDDRARGLLERLPGSSL